jgi:hypothetical protein
VRCKRLILRRRNRPVLPFQNQVLLGGDGRHTHYRVVRYLERGPYAHKADASDSESLVPDRYGQNVCGIALGRSNWIHIGSEPAGLRVAAILSVIKSCCRLKIPVRDYLADIMPGLANAPLQRITDLTPAAWAAKTSSMHLV